MLAVNVLTSLEGSINVADDTNDLSLTITGGGDSTVLGFLMQAAEQSTLDPAAPQIENANGTPLTPLFSRADRGGRRESLIVAELPLGEYTLVVGGDRGTTGAYQIDVFLPGDLSQDARVDDHELLMTTAAVVQTQGDWNHFTAEFFRQHGINLYEDLYREELDCNLDGVINDFDLEQVNTNVNAPAVVLELIGDQEPPEIDAGLKVDDGRDPDDKITSDPTIVGTITDESEIVSFLAGLDGDPGVDALGKVNPDGSFQLDPDDLESIAGGPLADGPHTLNLIAEDEHGNVSPTPTTLTFTLIADNDEPQVVDPVGDQDALEDTDLVVDISQVFGDADLPLGDNLELSVVDFDSGLVSGVTIAPTIQTKDTASVTATVAFVDDQNGGPTGITIRATDAMNASVDYTFEVTVTPVNDAPSFDLSYVYWAMLEDAGPKTEIGFATNISPGPANESGQGLEFLVTTDNDALFSVLPQIDADGTLTFTAADDANGTATVTIQLKDDGGTDFGGEDTSAPQTLTILVEPVNDAPSFDVGPDEEVLEDAGPRTVAGFATNISPGPADESGQGLEFLVTTDNDNLFSALPQIAPDGTLSYTPADDANGTATVTVKLKDDGGTAVGGQDTSAEQTFTINVTPVNDAPSFDVGPDQEVLEDAGPKTVAGFATNISPGPADEGGQVLEFLVSTDNDALFSALPQIAPDGTLTYTAADDANGSATVTVELKDDGGTDNGGQDTSAPQTFTINVIPVNDAPSFDVGADQEVLEDAGPQTVADFATNMSRGGGPDESGQALEFLVSTNNEALFAAGPEITPDGTLTYTTAAHANGTAIVTVELQDDGGTANGGEDTSAPQTFTITVTPVNDAPSFDVGADQEVLEDAGLQTVAGFAANVSPGGGSDESTQALTFQVSTNNDGLFSALPEIAPDGTLTYTPADDANGTAIVTVELKDDGGTDNGGQDTSASQTFNLSVLAVNDAPSFNLMVNPDQTVDEDAAPQTVANFAENMSPGGGPDESGQALSFLVSTDNDAMFSAVPQINAAGTLTYTPANDAFGTAMVTVELKDDGGTDNGGVDTSAPQTFQITVNEINDDPTANDDLDLHVTIDPAAQNPTSVLFVLDNDTIDPDVDETLEITSVSPATKGTAEISQDNLTILYTPNEGLPEGTTDIFTYTIKDVRNGQDRGGQATATVALVFVENSVTANDDSFGQPGDLIEVILEDGGPVDLDVMANDEDLQDDPFSIFSSTQGDQGGVVSQVGDLLRYEPAGDFVGEEHFQYTIEDARGARDTATVTVTVTPVNDAPSFDVGADQQVLEDADPQTVAGFATSISRGGGPDESTQALTFQVTTNNDGLFSALPEISPDGTLTYTPAGDANGTAIVTVELKDDGGTANGGEDTSAPQTFTITVTAVNDAPSFAVGADQEVLEDADPQTVAGFATNISRGGGPDESTQALTFQVSTNNDGLFSALPEIAPDGTLTYTPAGDANGTATVTVELKDDGGTDNGGQDTSAPQTFEINVIAVNDAPSFELPADPNQVIDEDPEPRQQTVADFASSISPGGGLDEAGQVLAFDVGNDNNGLFSEQPAIDASGSLTYAPAEDASGVANVTVTLKDDGGTDNGGQDTSAPQTFTITVNPVNDAPRVTSPIADVELTDGDPQPAAVDLSTVFTDPDGDALTFELDVDQSDINTDLVSVVVAGSTLQVEYFDYRANQDRSPSTVAVKASDPSGAEATDQFTIVIHPVYTIEVQLVVLGAPSSLDDAAGTQVLPTPAAEIAVGHTYVVEVWMKDLLIENVTDGPTTNGITGGAFNITFSNALSQGVELHHEGPYDLVPVGTIDNANGVIKTFGGGTLEADFGIEPEYVRLGYVTFAAAASGDQAFSLEFDQIARRGDVPVIGNVDASQVWLGSAAVTHAESSVFAVVEDESTVQISATVNVDGTDYALDPQGPGSDTTTVAVGSTIEAFLDDLANPTSISILGSDLDLNVSGSWRPDVGGASGQADADFGFENTDISFTVFGITINARLEAALRDLIPSAATSTPLAVDGSGQFASEDVNWLMAGGFTDYLMINKADQSTLDNGRVDLAGGVLAAGAGPHDPASITETSPGTYELRLPVLRTATFDVPDAPVSVQVTIDISGVLVARLTPASPLHGTETGEDTSVRVDGTGIYATLAYEPTPLGADGQVAALPASEAWVDEWDSYWVEVWVSTSEGPGVAAGSVDLAYNGAYFTATEIDHGGAFAGDTSGSIDDAAGLVAGLGGTTARTDAGGEGFALLARVKLESLPDDGVPVEDLEGLVGPYDLGLDLKDARLEVAGVGAVSPVLGSLPKTELWPVVYDVDDNDVIDFGDLAYFAEAFQQDVFDSDSPFVWVLDFDKSGTVGFGDLAYLAENFQGGKAAGTDVQFPASFAQRWVGCGVDSEGSTPVDQLLDAAVATWQEALGASDPVEVQLVVRDFGDSQIGEGRILEVNAEGRPVRGLVSIDDDAAGLGWYSDVDGPPAGGKYDLYTVLLHEVGHVLGFTPAYAGFAGHVQQDADAATFVGPDFSAVLDSTGEHLDAAAHPDDVMNPELTPGARKLPSPLDVDILLAAYEAAGQGAAGFSSVGTAIHAAFEFTPLAHEVISAEDLSDAPRPVDVDVASSAAWGIRFDGLEHATAGATVFASHSSRDSQTLDLIADAALSELSEDRPAVVPGDLHASLRGEMISLLAGEDSADRHELARPGGEQDSEGLAERDAVFEDWEDPVG